MTKVYLAAALFSIFDRERNNMIAQKLKSAGYNILLPQIVVPPMTKTGPDMKYVYNKVLELLLESDVVVALVDGSEVDTGVAWELGYASALGKPTICLRTDFRKSEANGVNIMIEYSASSMLYSTEYDKSSNESIEFIIKELRALKC